MEISDYSIIYVIKSDLDKTSCNMAENSKN